MNEITIPQTDINAFLIDEVSIEIYQYLEGNETDTLSVLDFFNLIYTEFNFYINNSENYLILKENFQKLSYETIEVYKQKENLSVEIYDNLQDDVSLKLLNLFTGLLLLVKNYNANKTVSKLEKKAFEVLEFYYIHWGCMNENSENHGTFEKNYRWNFDNLLNEISLLSNIKDKIKILLEKKSEFQQKVNTGIRTYGELFFDDFCEIEIEKLKQLLFLETQQNEKTTNTNTLKWHGKQTEFIELVKALIINENIKGTQVELIETLSNVFGITIKNPSKLINDIKTRNNGSETLFLDKLKKSLFNYISAEKSKNTR